MPRVGNLRGQEFQKRRLYRELLDLRTSGRFESDKVLAIYEEFDMDRAAHYFQGLLKQQTHQPASLPILPCTSGIAVQRMLAGQFLSIAKTIRLLAPKEAAWRAFCGAGGRTIIVGFQPLQPIVLASLLEAYQGYA